MNDYLKTQIKPVPSNLRKIGRCLCINAGTAQTPSFENACVPGTNVKPNPRLGYFFVWTLCRDAMFSFRFRLFSVSPMIPPPLLPVGPSMAPPALLYGDISARRPRLIILRPSGSCSFGFYRKAATLTLASISSPPSGFPPTLFRSCWP